MSKPNYRMVLRYDAQRKVFEAHVPELDHCTAEGTTRAEAVTKLEEEIDARLTNMLSHGSAPPKAVDEQEYSGDLTAKVSKTLHRDISLAARTEGVDLNHLVGELLATALDGRRGQGRVRPRDEGGDNAGNRRGPGGNFNNRSNPQFLDDRANFMEYVRGLEHAPPRQQGGRPGGHQNGQGHPGGGGGRNDRDRGRRRRGGPGGGGGGGRGPNQGQDRKFNNQGRRDQQSSTPATAQTPSVAQPESQPHSPGSSGGEPNGNV